MPGLVVSATVRDVKKLTKIQDALVMRAKDTLQRMGPQAPASLHEFTARQVKGYRVQLNNLPVPVAPAWVITKDQFVLGVSPQLVTAHLTAATTSLSDNPDIQAAFKRNPKSVMVSYHDPRPDIQGLYTLFNMFSPMLLGNLQQQGIEFNLPPLPPYSDIDPHLAPNVTTLSRKSRSSTDNFRISRDRRCHDRLVTTSSSARSRGCQAHASEKPTQTNRIGDV